MKKIILVILGVAALSFGAVGVKAEEPVLAKPKVKVEAYYFHTSFRCPTCNTMERYAREAIDTNFKTALASGKLEFRSVNVEDPGNEHFVDDYQLYTKTLILSLVKDGKEVKSKNLDKIWEYVRDKQRFVDYVTKGVSDFLKETE